MTQVGELGGGGYFYGGVQISLLDSMSFGPDYIYSHQI